MNLGVDNRVDGIVFGIQRFCVHDGPGIRTSIFLKGCNMRCAWCHNPEGIAFLPELFYTPNKCAQCGLCQNACSNGAHIISNEEHKIDRSRCVVCGACVDACIEGALSIMGTLMSVDEVLAKVSSDICFYKNSGGGVTLTGGEPFCQPEFTFEILKCSKALGIHTVIETGGTIPLKQYGHILDYTDLFLFDYKLTSDYKYLNWDGDYSGVVLGNLRLLNEKGSKIILRCPIIPGVNDNPAHFKAIANLTKEYSNILGFELMPYHNFGEGKAQNIGLKGDYGSFEKPSVQTVQQWCESIAGFGGKEWVGHE